MQAPYYRLPQVSEIETRCERRRVPETGQILPVLSDGPVCSWFTYAIEGVMANSLRLTSSNLMAPDDFKNLGLIFENDKATPSGGAEGAEKKE